MRQSVPLLCALFAACHGSNNPPQAVRTPSVTASANPGNVISALVGFTAKGTTSARVHFTGGGETGSTPARAFPDGHQEIAVLGLLPNTDYTLELETTDESGTTKAPGVSFRTGDLPAFLRDRVEFRVVGESSEGYTITNILSADTTRHYLLAFDGKGRVRWYAHVPGIGGYFEQNPNGNFTAFIGSTTGWQATYGYFVELNQRGEIVGRDQAPAPLYTDEHELIYTPTAGGGWTTHFCSYDIRRIDTTRIGGVVDAQIAGHQILRYTPDGQLDFLWNAWDHFVIDDWIEEPAANRAAAAGDFDHPNSLEIDLDGNYIVSFRNLAEVTKIDSRNGRVLWRFGGRNNQFTIVGDPLGKFCGQHSVRVLPNGNLLMFDNGLRHVPQLSRAVEYKLDTTAMTATMVFEYRHDPSLYAMFTGNVQRLANGNTIVGYAFRGLVTEVSPAGQSLWTGVIAVDGNAVATYRMNRIPSLYEYVPGHDVSRR